MLSPVSSVPSLLLSRESRSSQLVRSVLICSLGDGHANMAHLEPAQRRAGRPSSEGSASHPGHGWPVNIGQPDHDRTLASPYSAAVDARGGKDGPPDSPRKSRRAQGSWPLIGVTTSEVRAAEDVRPVAEGEPRRREMALGLTYLRAIERAGGTPVVLPPLGPAPIHALLDRLDALCLSGGPDLDPATYGQRAGEHLGPTWTDLDFFELAVARGADARCLPILAICRGMQTLNVARGGTLHQHLASDGVAHRQAEAAEEASHSVRVEPRTKLAAILGRDAVLVNSFHHQAVDRLGAGLRAVAWAADGVIEGVEAQDREFVLGVQWHAECLIESDESLALFASFVEAAGTRARLREAA